ncbi:MAG: hypothetical protein V4596_08045 [Bdellovibrionota bacterium]
MRFLLVLMTFLISLKAFAEKREGTVCYFSLNNRKEKEYMKTFADKINQQIGSDIKVLEYMPDGDDPEAAFEKMVQQNAKCDGLVISGHHYGEWEGASAEGALRINFLEKMSCNPKYAHWFKNLNSFHLQGCRTAGTGKIESNNPNDHTSRINSLAAVDSIEEDGTENLNYGFTNILSQSNPLSARYLKIFPRATMFGWIDSAPGVLKKSETSLLYHIVHMAKINNPSLTYTDPTKEISRENAVEYATAILNMIQKPDWDNCENVSIAGWEKHAPLAKGLKSFESSARKNPLLYKARELGCRLKFPKDPAERIQVLKKILSDKKLVAENFNALSELMQGPYAREASALMKNSDQLKSFLGDEINTPRVGLFVKIDYYTTYKKLFGTSIAAENIITNESIKKLTEPYVKYEGEAPTSVRDLADFKRTLTSSLAKNAFVTESFMMKLYGYQTKDSNQMFKVLYDKMRSSANPRQSELAPLVAKLKPLADSIPKSTP